MSLLIEVDTDRAAESHIHLSSDGQSWGK